MKKLKGALIGAGVRGRGLYRSVIRKRTDVEIVAVCDVCEEHYKIVEEQLIEEGRAIPKMYTDYKKCIDENKLDFVVVVTSWVVHLEVSMYAMEKGIPVACEVGGAYTIEELWDIVHCYERTKTPIMMLENCCYGRTELLALKMKRLGLLGEIVHCEGGYRHDLRREIVSGANGSHYRFQEYLHRNCDNYPTHEIGPIAMLLDINRGNRFTSLYAMSCKSAGLEAYIDMRELDELKGTKFNQGDVVTTLIKCQNGETVTIALDTTLPRYYSRDFLAQGTKGLVSEETRCVYLHGAGTSHRIRECSGNIEEYYEKYDHEMWKRDYGQDVHGGLDVRVFDEFFIALKNGDPMPIDVYDMATWMSITVLSAQSIETGLSVAVPDFTRGAWVRRKNNFAKEANETPLTETDIPKSNEGETETLELEQID